MRTNRLDVYRSPKNRRWFWRLVAANGHYIASSAEGDGYARKASARRIAYRVLSGAVPFVETMN